jgi:hypothetical protein
MINQEQFDKIEEQECEEDYYERAENWFEEEDLLTNFNENELPLYKKAIQEFGDDTLFISDEAYTSNGYEINGYYSLRTTAHKDRSDFWRLFEILEKENKEVL